MVTGQRVYYLFIEGVYPRQPHRPDRGNKQTIGLMDLSNMSWGKKDIRCRIGDLTETSSTHSHQEELVLTTYPPDQRLCVMTYLKEYVKRTKPLRVHGNQLFISCRKTHGAISRDSLRRWTKLVLTKTGLVLLIVHHTLPEGRLAISKAGKVLPLKKILKTVGWKHRSTFSTYYNKPR